MLKALTKVCDVIEKILAVLGMASVAVFFFMTCLQVFSRTTGIQISYTEEIANAMLAWCCFIGTAILVRKNGHFRFTAFCEKLTGKKFVVNESVILAIVLAFSILIAWHGILLTKQFSTWTMSTIPTVSRAWMWSCVPICGISSTLFSVECILKFVKDPSSRAIVSDLDAAMEQTAADDEKKEEK